ncbi:N-glycosylase/DNA lyase [Candidatus Woesearchaeota archaeon]|nr:N-glycosylase/DNA lyase [Candidatus Woesearchaeota archaeon]
MKSLIDEITRIKKTKVKDIIDKRIKEFKRLNSSSDRRWFYELCFCLMTANWKAQEGIELQKELCKDGFCNWSEKSLAKHLKKRGHRFWPQRAERIVLARRYTDNIKQILKKQEDPRQWLVKNIKGLGYKESSHFLRNVGYTDYAILDRHIQDILKKEKLLEESKTLTPKRYLETERVLKKIAQKTKLNQAELDLYIWYLKTGKVLK